MQTDHFPIIVWAQLRGSNAVAWEFLQSNEGDRHGGEKFFLFLLYKALEGEPIITWTCAVLKECLQSLVGRLTGKKEYLLWR